MIICDRDNSLRKTEVGFILILINWTWAIIQFENKTIKRNIRNIIIYVHLMNKMWCLLKGNI